MSRRAANEMKKSGLLAQTPVEHEHDGVRVLGPGVIATTEEPGEVGSVINWEGVNYYPEPAEERQGRQP